MLVGARVYAWKQNPWFINVTPPLFSNVSRNLVERCLKSEGDLRQKAPRRTPVIAPRSLANRLLSGFFGGGSLPASRAHRGSGSRRDAGGRQRSEGGSVTEILTNVPHRWLPRSVPTIPLPANYNAAPDFTLSLPPPMPTLLKR